MSEQSLTAASSARRFSIIEEVDHGLVLVRRDSGGVFPDGTTNTPAIDFDAPATLDAARAGVPGDESLTVGGHLYVHVAACPCPEMQAEMARLDAQEPSDD